MAHDARVFALMAWPNAEAVPETSLEPVACENPMDACFELSIAGAITQVHFQWDGARHVLHRVNLP